MFWGGIALLFNGELIAQHQQGNGIVQAGGEPLQGVTIKAGGVLQGVSNKQGRFNYYVKVGQATPLSLTAAGYLPLDTLVQPDSANKPLNITVQLKPDNALMEEIVVSGTLKAVSKMTSPIPVEVYHPAYFKKMAAPNIFEGLQLVNGVQPQINCNVCQAGDIHINGMEGPYTMVLIDGMPIVSSLSTVYGLSGIPNSIIKRIEVVKGPASTLYGSEAVGGLINIITKDARQGEKLAIDFSGTHFGELNTDAAFTKKMSKASAIFSANHHYFNQRRDINNDNFTDLTLVNRLSLFNKWTLDLGNNKRAGIALRYFTENRWGGEMQWQPALKGSDEVYGETISTRRVEVIGNFQFHKNWIAEYSYNWHKQTSFYGPTSYNGLQKIAFAQIRYQQSFGKHQLLAGLPLRYTYYNDNTPGTAQANEIDQPSRVLLPGIFVQHEYKASEKFTWLTGLRYDYDHRHGNIVTPRLSIKYSPNINHSFRMSSGNGYRVVNLFTEDHAALSGARQVIIASALLPERSWNANINYTGFLRHKHGFVTLDASAFYTHFTNRIVGDFLTDPNKIIYDNLKGHAISKGLSLNVNAQFTNGLNLMAGATWMDVYQMENKGADKPVRAPQLFAPRLSGTFAISYNWAKKGWLIDLTGRISGPMYLPVVPNDFRPEQSPDFALLNLQLTKKITPGVEWYGGVKNLLNFLPVNPILHPDDPFDRPGGLYFDTNGQPRPDTNPNGYTFDPSYNYAPLHGAKFFTGIRWTLK
jgi:outer membrane receptor for ferrienterochelin and colicins